MYVWKKTVGKQSSVEISSRLQQFIITTYIGSDVITLVIFSDDYGVQNEIINSACISAKNT